MSPRARSVLASLLVAAACLSGASVQAFELGTQRVGAQFRYWSFTRGNDLRDPIVYWASRPLHVQLEYWDFVRGDDQFRPEVGVHLLDRRRSSYTLQWRHERNRERYTARTEQLLAGGFVALAEVSPIVAPGHTDWVAEGGLDYYFGSYNFEHVSVIRDPRNGGLWVVPMRLRLATERNDWVQLTVAPTSGRTLGWAADAKLRVLRLGVERNSRYDFTNLDNVIVTAGVEVTLPGAR